MTTPKQPKPVEEIIEEAKKDREQQEQELISLALEKVDEKIRVALVLEDEKGMLRHISQLIGRSEPELRAIANGMQSLTDYERIILMDQFGFPLTL